MKKYTQLKLEEREVAYKMKQEGKSLREIGRALGRHHSTIGREFDRNYYKNDLPYLPHQADLSTKQRRHVLGKKIDRYPKLKEYIFDKLNLKWSPDVIAAKSEEEVGIKISREAIYDYCYAEENRKKNWYLLLASKRKKRLHKHARKPKKTMIPNRVSISERPEIVNNRAENGHLEGDLTFCRGNRSMNILTVCERVSRLILLVKNKNKQPAEVAKNCFNALAELPPEMRKSITFDNGLEFKDHWFINKFLGVKTYFCDPHSPWQKGQVEKSNAMIHRFISKNSSLADLTQDELLDIQNQINNIPRKILKYLSPLEVYNQMLNQENRSSVALRT